MLMASEALAMIREGSLTARALVDSCIEQIERLEPEIHAWVVYDKDRARIQADLIDRRMKEDDPGLLTGIPIGIKDIYNTLDFPTEMGSPIWKGFTPGNDSRSVFYLRENGAIILGKTVTAEFAVHHPGPTVNPHNHLHTPGTSSSGSAAAVATSMVPMATGSQTAGSTIRPASYCGIYGYKPSFGLVPRTGVLKTVDVLDHVTLFARSIDDISLGLEAMRIRGYDHPYISTILDDDTKQNLKGPWRLAFVRTHLWDNWQPYAQKAILEFVQALSKVSSVVVEEVVLPDVFRQAHDLHRVIYNKALSYYYQDEYDKHQEELSRVFREMLEDGQRIPLSGYKAAIAGQAGLAHAYEDFIGSFDCLITLSTAGEAKQGLDSVDTIDSCLIWTLCGAPAINLPVFTGPNRLPFGAQLVARKYHDRTLLALGRHLLRHGLISDVTYDF
jgi:Asp-tRNA(Asn)/Glu-tRNA(Gln) amidotransferase A subunit family amidase